MAKIYRETREKEYTYKIRKIKKQLPPYCNNFLNARADSMEVRSRYEYAKDLLLFLKYVKEEKYPKDSINIEEIPLKTIEDITPEFIDSYKEYLTLYNTPYGERKNGENGKSRKLATLRAFYKHLNKRKLIDKNPAILVDMPKKHKNEIITLKPDQEARLLAAMDKGTGRTRKEKELYRRNHLRDKAVVLMLLGTGLRISELAGLDVKDVDLTENTAKIVRKGGSYDTVYFSEQVADALKAYLRESDDEGTRQSFHPDENETALFLTVRKNRYSVRGLQEMIKGYARSLFGEDTKLSAHKLRATFGSALYRETGDIKLAAEALHHSSVATTERFYVAFDEERKKLAARTVPTNTKEIKNNQEKLQN